MFKILRIRPRKFTMTFWSNYENSLVNMVFDGFEEKKFGDGGGQHDLV